MTHREHGVTPLPVHPFACALPALRCAGVWTELHQHDEAEISEEQIRLRADSSASRSSSCVPT